MPAFPLFGLLAGMGLGLAKTGVEAAYSAPRSRKLAAETQRYSPWTGLQAQPVERVDPFGNLMQGAVAGAGMQQAAQRAENVDRWLGLMEKKYGINQPPEDLESGPFMQETGRGDVIEKAMGARGVAGAAGPTGNPWARLGFQY